MLQLCLFTLLFAQGPTTAEGTLAAYRSAVDKGDVDAFAKLTSGPMGNTLRTLSLPLKKAQTASEAFSKALGEKPALGLTNPFADDFNPLKGYVLEIIEVTPGKDEQFARVRFGTVGRLKEETLSVKKEGDVLRVSLPSVYLKSLRLITPEQLTKQADTLNRLAEILTSLAGQVAKGELTSKEAIVLKLAQAVKDAKLAEVK